MRWVIAFIIVVIFFIINLLTFNSNDIEQQTRNNVLVKHYIIVDNI